VGEALAHIRGAAEGLEFAAQKGLSHGALGPTNLLLDAKGNVLISDLGWAGVRSYAVTEENDLRSSSSTGLPEGNDLVAPELIGGGQPPDQASDVYSLGATLFFLISGMPPKWDKRRGTVPALSEFARDLPAGLQHVFARMIAHDRTERYATLADALQALADPAAAEAADYVPPPVEAPPPPTVVPFYKQPGGGAVITFIVVFGLIAATLGVMTALGSQFTPWDWGRGAIVAAMAALVFQVKRMLLDVSMQMPILVGALSGFLWAIIYYALSLPAADLMADLCYITVGLATGAEVDPGACLVGFGLLSGIFAGAMSYRGAVFMGSGAYLPVMAMAIFISGYEIQVAEDLAFENDDEGLKHIKDGEYRKAIAFYNKIINGNPKRAGAFFHRGRAHDGIGDTEQALKDFETAIKLRPKNPEGFSRRGDVYRKEKDYRKAYDDYRASLELDRNQPKVQAKRGEVLLEMGETEDALADFNDAIVANDRDPTVYINRAKALEKMGKVTQAKADREKAKALFEELSQ
jgi:tetratricopeptide (TPR) repeat protein